MELAVCPQCLREVWAVEWISKSSPSDHLDYLNQKKNKKAGYCYKIPAFLFIFYSLLFSCSHKFTPEISQDDISFLESRMSDSSQNNLKSNLKANSWPANRRYFFLIKSFAQTDVLRCDHFLPDKRCFSKAKSNFLKILNSERILVQAVVQAVQEDTGAYYKNPKNKYSYIDNHYKYKSGKQVRTLKNFYISVSPDNPSDISGLEPPPEYILFFDYLVTSKKDIQRIAFFLELTHYFTSTCTPRPGLWYFTEGDVGLDYALKKTESLKKVLVPHRVKNPPVRARGNQKSLSIYSIGLLSIGLSHDFINFLNKFSVNAFKQEENYDMLKKVFCGL